jgi:isoaspartyl peptidase/L-asparaginase-like protein (Ntn-hydrolase superfamily)
MGDQGLLLSTWWFGLPANLAGLADVRRRGGALDAMEKVCVFCELDPCCDSVGVGGLPDASGEVSLDGAVMLSPAKSAGVAYVRKYAHPVSIARRVMERTIHKLLVGEGAERFAAAQGFQQATLLTDAARRKWEEWKQTGAYRDFHIGELDAPATGDAPLSGRTEGARRSPEDSHDTIGVLALDAGGTIGAACSTSGRAFKLPGRVGDSPLIGPGLYCDPRAGAAVATGTGELMIGVAASFLVTERMRGGDAPLDAVRYVLGRVVDSYPDLGEKDQCALIALTPDGRFASGALRGGFQVAVTDGRGRHELVTPDVVLLG